MNTPESQNIELTQHTPNAPLANRVRATDERRMRQVRRRLDFDATEGNDDPPAVETHWRLKAIEVKMVYGYPVHKEHTLTVELFDHLFPDNRTFNEALDDGRLVRGSYVHRKLTENGHVSLDGVFLHRLENYDTEEEYKRKVNEMFRSITYIKL